MPERCGANFRKPVSHISDRAKRYRAHSPGCRPSGPKVCFKCGSRRFVVPDHIDGDESNGRRSNLRWACKSHNTILGKKMAKAGKGVRTRQYNPRRKNAGAKTLGAYVDAAVNHTRGAHDAGGKTIHDTPKAKRKEFAREIAWRKGYRSNPELKESKKLTHAAVKYENISQHKGQACQNCLHFIAANPPRCEGVQSPISPKARCKRYEPTGSDADDLYKKFHGRGPDKIVNLQIAGIDPYGNHPALTSLGPLIRLVVGEGTEIGNDGSVVDEGDFTNELTFVPMTEYRRATETMNGDDPQEVRELKAWLKKAGAPDVAGVPPNGKQIYFVGGNQALDDAELRKLGCDPEKDFCDLGDCYLIEYFAQKRFDQFEPMTYYHHLGEENGERPRLWYFRQSKMLVLGGGGYIVKASGINN